VSESDPANAPAAVTPSDGGAEPESDPAIEAIRHHLDALEHQRFDAAPDSDGGRAEQLRRRLADHSPAVVDQRSVDADRHLAMALRALSERVDRIADWQRQDHQLAGDLKRALDVTAERLDQLTAVQHGLEARLDALTERVHAAETTQHDDATMLRVEVNRVRAGSESLAHVLRGTPTIPQVGGEVAGADADSDTDASVQRVISDAHEDFYRQLEQRFRGSRTHIKSLTEVYVDDVRATGGPVLDIGCGTGEWLELLGEHDIPAYGVDTNAAFAEDNRARGLDVRVGDAVAHLAALAPGSLGAVTGFHLAEHLDTEVLLRLIDRARVALRPGGLLILETPNPTNVRVGAAQFWIDPTHIRPLHPELLAFMCTQRGFAEVEIRTLHPARHFEIDWGEALGLTIEPGSPAADILEDLRDALAGGQDYAVLARATESTLDASSDDDA
jgi:O-antigen chain-terminating methyltransferase